MILKRISWLMAFLLVVTIALVGCGSGGGGGKKKNDAPAPPINPIISTFSLAGNEGKNVYILCALANRVEGDTNYIAPYNVTVSSANPSSVADNFPLRSSLLKNSLSRRRYPYGDEQMKMDSMLRQREADNLRRRPQSVRFSQKISFAPALGETRSFIVYVTPSQTQSRNFIYKKTSANCYIWVDSTENISDAILDDYVTDFEASITELRTDFGHDQDTDGEGPIYILISSVFNDFCGGYFNSTDKYAVDGSNNHDIVYLANNSYAVVGKYTAEEGQEYNKATLAHEFQHMINFDCHYRNNAIVPETIWLNEGLSELASYVCGHGDANNFKIKAFLDFPVGITVWDQTSSSYGAGLLFTRYIYERYPAKITNMVNTNLVGIANIESTLGVNFDEFITDFYLALCYDGTGYSVDPRYEFATLNLRTGDFDGLLPWQSFQIGNNGTALAYPYEPVLLPLTDVGTNSTITFSVVGSPVKATIIGLEPPDSF